MPYISGGGVGWEAGSSLGVNQGPHLCPLPLLTHAVGTYFNERNKQKWDAARNASAAMGGYSSGSPVVGHFNMGFTYADKEKLFAAELGQGFNATGLAITTKGGGCFRHEETDSEDLAAVVRMHCRG